MISRDQKRGHYRPKRGHHRPKSGHYRPKRGHYRRKSAHHRSKSDHYRPKSGHYRPKSGHHKSKSGHHRSKSGQVRFSCISVLVMRRVLSSSKKDEDIIFPRNEEKTESSKYTTLEDFIVIPKELFSNG